VECPEGSMAARTSCSAGPGRIPALRRPQHVLDDLVPLISRLLVGATPASLRVLSPGRPRRLAPAADIEELTCWADTPRYLSDDIPNGTEIFGNRTIDLGDGFLHPDFPKGATSAHGLLRGSYFAHSQLVTQQLLHQPPCERTDRCDATRPPATKAWNRLCKPGRRGDSVTAAQADEARSEGVLLRRRNRRPGISLTQKRSHYAR
jgi:hypothetical protein